MEVRDILEKEFIERAFNSIRASGEEKHNYGVLERGEGELLVARRPRDKLVSYDHGTSPTFNEWMLKASHLHHQITCMTHTCNNRRKSRKGLIVQLDILSRCLAQSGSLPHKGGG